MQTLTRIALVCLALAVAGCAGAVSGGDAGRRPAADPPDAATFQLPEARVGQLSLGDGRLRFTACGDSGPGRIVADLDDGRGSRLVRELGHTAEGIPVLVRLSGAQLTEIRYAAPGPHSWLYRAQGEDKGAFLSLELDGPAAPTARPAPAFRFARSFIAMAVASRAALWRVRTAYPGHE